jgi:tape measure domain-containing protein
MQSGGQSAGIQLQVGLDLAFFRGQLPKLGAAAASYPLTFDVKFNRKSIQNELNNLNANIKKRNYFLEVKTNLASEIELAKKLATALNDLGKSRQAATTGVGARLGVGVLGRAPLQGGLASKDVEKLYRASARAGLLAFSSEIVKSKATMVAAMEAVGVDTIAGLLNGLNSQDERVQAAARSLGESLIKSIKTTLGIASPSKKFEEIGRNVGEGFEKGALFSMDKAFDALEGKMRQRGKILDTVARGIFRMLGMDPAAMLQQARQQRLPPSINWQATAPRQPASIGPSSAGRALPSAAERIGLPGTSFATQKLLSGDLLTPSMKAAIRDVANDLIDGIRDRINTAIRQIKVEDLGRVSQRMLTGSSVAGYLPPVARFGEGRTPSPYSTGRLGRDGETQAELFARREREARMRSAQREMQVLGGGAGRPASPYSYVNRPARPTSAIVPYAAGGALVPAGGGAGGAIPPRPPSGGGGMGGMANFGRALGGINLPGTGLVREIGEEFAMATKQVLLFGTAYKALAFATSFPAQVGQAVGALQSFNNTLKAISPSAEEARASNQFILDIVDRYNVPLQSARDGFTKLYASMAPAGFKGDEIRALFTGVSQAAATFGMSADKVDRVNYAFAQMASKGQVMSEELKGQLGDVLPGAMGIFAEAAGFQGPDAIQKFSKALEDGAFKGEAMRQLLKNVTIVMTKEFGPGAEGAARTFQGVINRMQNSTKLLYEAFEPVAVGFLNSVVVPLTSGIKTVADGFNSFFTGVNAKTSGGFAIAQELEKLKPAFEGIRANVAALMPTLKSFGSTLLGVGKVFLQIAGNPFVAYLGRVYLNVLALTTAIQLLNLRALIPMIANFARSLYALVAFAVQCVSTGTVVQRLGMAVQVTGLMLRTFFATTGIGLVLVGIGLLTERFISMNQALADTKAKALGAADAIRAMSQTEARQASQQYDRQAQSLKGLSKEIEDGKMKSRAWIEVTKEQAEALKSAGITVSDVRGSLQVQPMRVGGAYQKVEGLAAEARFRVRGLDYQDKQIEQPTNISPVTGLAAGEGGSAADKAAKEAARLASQQQQNAIDAANRQNALNQAITEGMMTLDDQAFQHRINLIDARNNYELAGLNSIEARQEKFQQDLQKIELDRINTVRKAQQEVQKASLQYAAAQNTAAAAVTGGGGGKATFGDTGRTFNAPGWVHGHFQNMNREALVTDTVQVVMGLLQQGSAAELSSGTQFKQGMSQSQIERLVRQGIASHKKYPSGASAIDVFVPKGTAVPTPLSGVGNLGGAAGVTGSLPGGSQLMHLDPKSASGGVMQRREDKAGGKLVVEQQQLSNQQIEAGIVATNAANEALAQRKALIASNINTIFPVAEQRLENDLMKIRNQLQLQGMPQEYIEYQESVYKGAYESAEAMKRTSDEILEYEKALKPLADKKSKNIELTATEAANFDFLTQKIQQNDASIVTLTAQQKEYNISALEGAIATLKNADALKAQQETMSLIKGSVESASSSYKGFMKEVAMGGDPSEALKKFQEAITDQVLTVFFDFAMKPVEDFFKNQLSAMFGVETEESAREKAIAKMEEQLAVQKSIEANVAKIANPATPGTAATSATPSFNPSGTSPTPTNGFPIAAPGGIVASATEAAMNGAALPVDAAALAGTTNSVSAWGDSLNAQVSESLTKATETTKTEGNALGENLGKAVGAVGMAAGAAMGIVAGISQIKEGSTSGVLGGIGSIFMSLGGAIGGFAGMFKGANGGVAAGGWKPFPVTPFANGGMVSGPTLGLVGEGKYNEAIVPLPDGKSIPVQMRGGGGGGGLREAMNGSNGRAGGSPILNMSFQSTNINGVEYVSRDQLEQAMAATRRQAASDGAKRGMSMTLDKLQQSPSTRSRLGMGGR